MTASRSDSRLMLVALVTLGIASACSNDGTTRGADADTTAPPTIAATAVPTIATSPPPTEPPATEPTATDPRATDPPATEPPSTEPLPTDPPPTDPPATTQPVDTQPFVAIQDEVTTMCDAAIADLGSIVDDGTLAGVLAQLSVLTAPPKPGVPVLGDLSVPPDGEDELAAILELDEQRAALLAEAETLAAAGDVGAAQAAIDEAIALGVSIGSATAIAGADCAHLQAARAAAADVTTLLHGGAEQLNTGFGSIWVSAVVSNEVFRVDVDSGEVLATIEVGSQPLKLQPADGRVWVRTSSSYDAIDASTNEVTASLLKADVGPAANRNWALDGTMWICDGRRLHRYDPSTIEPVAVVELDVECDFVWANDELAIVWRYDEDQGESGTSAMAVVDPVTNAQVASIPLPVDVLFPALTGDAVFFAGNGGSTAVVIDRATWTIRETVDLGRVTGGGGVATDGTRIYVPTHDSAPNDVAVVDAATFEVLEVIEPLDVNGVAVDPSGSLWVVHRNSNVLQRFDVSE